MFPDAGTAERLVRLALQLRGEYGLAGRPRPAGLMHVTLHFLGHFAGLPQALVRDATAAAATVAIPPFEVAFDRVMSFAGRPDNLPLVLVGGAGIAGMAGLHDALGGALVRCGVRLPGAGAGYRPHLTLLYGGRAAERAVDEVRWRVQEFVLVRSFTGRSRYQVLAGFPLRS